MNIILFIIILSVLVFINELGHFLFAKMTNTKVHSFAIGFEPTLLKKKIGETTYKLNLIPFGGYVRIHGQDGTEEITEDKHRAFLTKPVWAKIGILIGGVFFNVIFAWLLLSTALMAGTPSVVEPGSTSDLTDVSTRILAVGPNSPIAQAGIEVGDEVVKIDHVGVTHEEPNTKLLVELLEENPEAPFTFHFADKPAAIVTAEVPPGGSDPKLGLSIEAIGTKKLGFFPALKEGFQDTRQMTQDTIAAFVSLITDAFRGSADVSSLTGPVGLVGMVGDAASYGISYLLFFTALISINLAVLNLIPFPALDGGQILFVLIEAVIRRPINPKVANIVNMLGFGILMLLMISVSVFDIVKLF